MTSELKWVALRLLAAANAASVLPALLKCSHSDRSRRTLRADKSSAGLCQPGTPRSLLTCPSSSSSEEPPRLSQCTLRVQTSQLKRLRELPHCAAAVGCSGNRGGHVRPSAIAVGPREGKALGLCQLLGRQVVADADVHRLQERKQAGS